MKPDLWGLYLPQRFLTLLTLQSAQRLSSQPRRCVAAAFCLACGSPSPSECFVAGVHKNSPPRGGTRQRRRAFKRFTRARGGFRAGVFVCLNAFPASRDFCLQFLELRFCVVANLRNYGSPGPWCWRCRSLAIPSCKLLDTASTSRAGGSARRRRSPESVVIINPHARRSGFTCKLTRQAGRDLAEIDLFKSLEE